METESSRVDLPGVYECSEAPQRAPSTPDEAGLRSEPSPERESIHRQAWLDAPLPKPGPSEVTLYIGRRVVADEGGGAEGVGEAAGD